MAANIKNRIDEAAASLKSSGAKDVYIFGSAAHDAMREGSDVDFAVSGLRPEKFFKALSAASRVLDRPLDLVDLDEVTPFTRYLKEEGELKRVGEPRKQINVTLEAAMGSRQKNTRARHLVSEDRGGTSDGT